MGFARVISPEERQWFRRCRRAWDFGSPDRQNLVPQGPGAGTSLLAAVRMAMAVWYFPGMWEWPRAIVEPRAMQAFDEAAAGAAAKDDVEEARAMLERYFAWAPAVDTFSPVRIEVDFEAGIPDPRTPGHELIDAGGRPVRYHDRIQVLLADAHDDYWVMEHRLVLDGWAAPDELLLAERPVAAAWGWENFYLGMEFAGTVHNELRLRASTASGHNPPADDPGRVAAVEEDGEWFRRTWIRRPRAEIAAVGDNLFGEALEMVDPGLRLYPSPNPEHCRLCHFRLPCLALNDGTDPAAALANGYRPRRERGPEEGRLGGGSWSMNRGAAPPPKWRKPE